jgi:hypothetical protein
VLICLCRLYSVPLRFTSYSQHSSLQNRSKTVQGRNRKGEYFLWNTVLAPRAGLE